MDLWTFVTIIVIIVVSGNVKNKAYMGLQADKVRRVMEKEIDDLKQRVNELEEFSKKGIEKRLQAIETIVVDSDYHLTMRFKKVLEDDNSEDEYLFNP